jgi:hypothetical protein
MNLMFHLTYCQHVQSTTYTNRFLAWLVSIQTMGISCHRGAAQAAHAVPNMPLQCVITDITYFVTVITDITYFVTVTLTCLQGSD